MPRLRAGEFDLALIFEFGASARARAGPAELRAVRGPHAARAPRRAPARRKRARQLEDLADEAWVQTSAASPCARHVVRVCRAAGFEPRVSFESDDYQTVQGLVAAGVGVALIPQLALSQRSATTSRSASSSPTARSGTSSCRRRGPRSRRPRLRRCWRSCATGSPVPALARPRGADPRRRTPEENAAPSLAAGTAFRCSRSSAERRLASGPRTDTPATGRPRDRPRGRGRRCRPPPCPSRSIRSGTNSSTSFSRMNVPIAENTITQSAGHELPLEQFSVAMTMPRDRDQAVGRAPVAVDHRSGSAKTPVRRPPANPANPCV